jgi:hypothetical protein
MLNNENPQSYQTCFRNIAQMISTMSMKEIHFICANPDGPLSYKHTILSSEHWIVQHCCAVQTSQELITEAVGYWEKG